MPRRIRSRPLTAWRDPEAVFRARFAEAPYAVWLDGGADAVSGVSIIAAAHAGSEFVTADAARGTVTRSAPLAEGDVASTVAASVFDVLAGRLPHAAPGRRASRTTPAAAATRPSAGSAGSATSSAPGSTTSRRRPPRLRMPRSSSSTGPSCSTTASERCGSRGSSPTAPTRGDAGERWAEELASALEGEHAASAASAARCRPPRRRPTPARLASPGGTTPSGTPSSSPPARPRSARATPTSCASPTASTSTATRPGRPPTSRCARSSPSHHGGYLRFGDVALLSASPERFLDVDPDGIVRTQADQGHPPARRRPGARRRARGASCSRARRSAPRTS